MIILKCIDDRNRPLTLNKIYTGTFIDESLDYYQIIDDKKRIEVYCKWRFKDVTREVKLKKLI